MKRVALALALTAGLAAAPAHAGSVDRVSFGSGPTATFQIVDRAPGRTEITVASNSAFTLLASDMVGDVSSTLSETIGTNAQAPGPQSACTWSAGFETPVYSASRKTARLPGSVASQSVRIVVHHSDVATPAFRIMASDEKTSALPRCS